MEGSSFDDRETALLPPVDGSLTDVITPSRRARRLAATMEVTVRAAEQASPGEPHGAHHVGAHRAPDVGAHRALSPHEVDAAQQAHRPHHVATADAHGPAVADMTVAATRRAHVRTAVDGDGLSGAVATPAVGVHLGTKRIHGAHASHAHHLSDDVPGREASVALTAQAQVVDGATSGAHRRASTHVSRRPLARLRTRLGAARAGDADSRLGRLRSKLSARPRRQLPVVVVAVMVAALVATGLGCAQQSVVALDVDGTVTHATALSGTVGDMLDANGVKVGSHDLVSPALDTPAYGVNEVVVRHAHQVTVDLNGKPTTEWTTAQNVDELMDDLGVRGSATVSASRSEPIDRNGMTVSVSTEKNVTVVVDGQTLTGTTNAATVGDVLAEDGVMLGENDRTTVPLSAPTVDGLVVSVVRVASSNGTVMESIPYNTVQQDDPTLPKGETKVAQKGAVGTRKSVYEVQQVGGVNVGKTLVAASVVAEPTDEIVKVGTKDPTTDTSPLPDYGTGDPRSIGREMVQQRGWGDDQFVCLDNLWTHESGWRVDATNPSSGAYGIPQALPGSKMASVGSDWKTNPATQITWGLNYIASRYGTPCGAWSSFQVKHWY